MINDRQKLNNIDNTTSNDDNNSSNNNNRNNNLRHHISLQRTNNKNNGWKRRNSSSSAIISGGRDRLSVTHSFRRYACQQCDKIFTDPDVLRHHSRSTHSSSSSSRCHSCPECSKNFASSSGLKQHQHIHQSVKPFRCEVCLKAYTQFSNLCRHKRMHADCRQQIRCPDCAQPFSTLMSLNKHRRFCEGVALRRHNGGGVVGGSAAATGGGSVVNPCFLPLHAGGLDGAGSIVNPGASGGLAIHPSLGALESWCMHLYGGGCRPSSFPVCSPAAAAAAAAAAGYMACLPPSSTLFPSRSMLVAAAAAQSSPLLFGSYMGLIPSLEESGRKEDQLNVIRSSSSSAASSSSSAEKRKRSSSREQKSRSRDSGQSCVTSPIPEAERPEVRDVGRSIEGCINVKKEKEEEAELAKEEAIEEDAGEEMEEERRNLNSPSKDPDPDCRTPGSLPVRTASGGKTDSNEDQQPLDLSTRSRTQEEVKTPSTGTRTFTCLPVPPPSRSRTFETNPAIPTSKNPRHSSLQDPQSLLVPTCSSTGFLSSVYHLRKELIASYAGARDPSNGTSIYHRRPELDNIRGFVGGGVGGGKASDHGPLHQSTTLLSPLVRLPDILSFKTTKPRYRYSCRYCGKVFPRSANLTRHLRTHTGEQPYRCKYCKRCFSISSNLQRHVRNIHNKEKPFRCPLCERCFGQQTNLDRHVKKHDSDTLDPCFPSPPPSSEYPVSSAAGSRPSVGSRNSAGEMLPTAASRHLDGVKGQVEPQSFFKKEIHNYFASVDATSSSALRHLGRVRGHEVEEEVTGSDDKEEEEMEEEEVGEGQQRMEVKIEGVDDTLE